MFKKSRRKIVAAILSVLILLLFGTLCVIYLASYAEMTDENHKLLEQYVDEYSVPGTPDSSKPDSAMPKDSRGAHRDGPPMLELSTFYSVAVSKDGQVLKVDTADISTLSEDALIDLADDIIKKGSVSGVENNLVYRMADKGEYILVAFLDNTLMQESAGTLINYTLLFGGAALLPLFFLARYLADRIVSPLEESYQRQKQFVSDAGHELKTPVAVINANAELLSREIGENKWLANIRYENERMSSLIIQLLDLARAENVTPPMEPVDLCRLVLGEVLPFETVAYESGVSLNSDIGEDVCVLGNSVQLKQLVSILLYNALRHSVSGKEVCISLRRERGQALLSVINDGEEIAPEVRKHLFERFYRTDAARTGDGNNYGLGLAIAKAIVSAHRSSIDVICRNGKVEFAVKIPLLKQVSSK